MGRAFVQLLIDMEADTAEDAIEFADLAANVTRLQLLHEVEVHDAPPDTVVVVGASVIFLP